MVLEGIKNKKGSLQELVDNGSVNVSILNDFDWLIQQAEEKEKLRKMLEEIKVFANDVKEFNYPCDKIYNMATKGLGEKE